MSVAGYFVAAHYSRQVAIFWLVAVSIFFYAWWRPENLPLFLGSIVFNFLAARFLSTSEISSYRRAVFVGAVLVNLVLLAFFKYGGLRCKISIESPARILPCPTSSCRWGQFFYLHPDRLSGRSLPRAADLPRPPGVRAFRQLFSHLLAGPILHHEEMLPQFNDQQIGPLGMRISGGDWPCSAWDWPRRF